MQEKVTSEEDVTFLLDIVENIIYGEKIIIFFNLYFTHLFFIYPSYDNLQLQGTSILGNLLL